MLTIIERIWNKMGQLAEWLDIPAPCSLKTKETIQAHQDLQAAAQVRQVVAVAIAGRLALKESKPSELQPPQ